ncbi:MAG: hypothetical protein D6729_08045 [Deltaproteobacteria bacterium]|nr:MAG: hypothetical protein D6729_08045 [Deltaproteobacteria bacterium]
MAEAGPDQLVAPAADVLLDAQRSFSLEARPLAFLWTQVLGPSVTLSDPGSATTRFRAPASPADLVFLLTVSDGVRSAHDEVHVRVGEGVHNLAPFPDAGPDRAVVAGSSLTLDASASVDPDGDALTFEWSLLDPAGAPVPVAAGPSLALGPLDAGPLVVRLGASDGLLEAAALVVVRVVDAEPVPEAPLVDVSAPATVEPGQPVTLTAVVDDPDGDPVRSAWRQRLGPPVPLTAASGGPSATFDAPRRVVRLAFLFQAWDPLLRSAPRYVALQVGPGAGNTAPIADAGPDREVRAGERVQLDGEASVDPDGTPLEAYLWQQLAGPDVTLEPGPDVPAPSFLAPERPATLLFSLEVFDGTVWSAPDRVRLIVLAP